MKSLRIFGAVVFFVICSVSLFGCSPAYKATKLGDELLKGGNHYGAAKEYLSGLSLDPNYQKAKLQLCMISKQAYEQELAVAENFEKTSDFESALAHYSELEDFLKMLKQYNCLNFPAINVGQKITEMKSASSEKYYKLAEAAFANEDYSNAIQHYKTALKFNTPYKDSIQKIAESYYRVAQKAESQKKFRFAANNYVDCIDTVKGYKDAAQRATSLYYSLGKYFLTKGLCRNAYNDFAAANKINADFKDLSVAQNEADVCSVTKVAFVRIDNLTGKNIAGTSIGDFIFDEIKAKLQQRKSRFIHVMDREELGAILGEQKLGMAGITDEYTTFKTLKGVHYLIFGKLTQVNSVHKGPENKQLTTTGKQGYTCIKTDSKGRTGEYLCFRDIKVSFTKVSESISVALAGSIKVLSVSSGETVVAHSINSKESDSIEYAEGFSESISDVKVDPNVESLATARKTLQEEDTLMKKIIGSVTNEMVQKVLDKVDRATDAPDPVEMQIFR